MRTQRGAALLTVLLLVAVMGVLLMAMLDDIRFGLRRAGNAQAVGQAQWHALGAEALARSRIQRMTREGNGRTTLAGGWNGRSLVFP
jgi:general secretion pathway protein K